jgi:hypothetical protein
VAEFLAEAVRIRIVATRVPTSHSTIRIMPLTHA